KRIRYRIPAAEHREKNPRRLSALAAPYRLLSPPAAPEKEREDARLASPAGADSGDKTQRRKFPGRRRCPTGFASDLTVIFLSDRARSAGHRDPNCEAVARLFFG